jgi:HlyD family secretion protein
VEQDDFTVDMIEAGEVQALSERVISAPETRLEQIQVIKLAVDGSMVKQGDFLAQLDAGELETELSLAVDELAVAKANYQKILAQQSLTMHNYENNLKLYGYSYEQAQLQLQAMEYEAETKKEQSRLNLKQAEIDLNRVKQQYESQKIIQSNERIQNEANIRQVQGEIKSLREQIGKMVIKAPADGMVIYKEVGSWQSRERLKEGYKARHGEALLSIPDLSRLQIQLYVNEVDRSQVQPGQFAEIVLDAFPQAVFHGKVIDVSRLAQNVRGTSTLKGFSVLVNVDETDVRLKPGMSAKVRIALDSLKNILTVPMGVVHEVDGKPSVYRRGKSKPTYVTLGPRNDSRVVVLKGLKAGMKLSWLPENFKGAAFGATEEKRRIALAAAKLEQSMSQFEKKGTLYDYTSQTRRRAVQQPSSQEDEGTQDMLKQALQRRGGGDGGGVQITPEMMERMRNVRARRQGDSTGTRLSNESRGSGIPSSGRNERAEPASRPQGEPSFEVTPEMRERFRAMRQQRQQEGGVQGGEAPGREQPPSFMRGDSTGRGGFEVTPEMRERFRAMRQRRRQEGGVEGEEDPGRGQPPRMMRRDSTNSDTTSFHRRRQE